MRVLQMPSRTADRTGKSRQKVRCAIYTRKSNEEGLEQDFNSLDAQREAGEAFILSQKHEGWVALPALYDDGGYSGGTMQRPALQRLLADIAAGGVDIIVVYKVDRLTRALSDFAKIVEVFDRHSVSFDVRWEHVRLDGSSDHSRRCWAAIPVHPRPRRGNRHQAANYPAAGQRHPRHPRASLTLLSRDAHHLV